MQHGEPSGDAMMGNRTASSDSNHEKELAEKSKEKVRYRILLFVF